MDFSDSLDLCLSCGNHVADATPYCSTRCLGLDRSARRNLARPSEEERRRSSSSHRSSPQSAHRQRRPLLDYQQDPQSSSSAHSSQRAPSSPDEEDFYLEDLADSDPPHVQKLASIAEWAEGVWGGAPSDGEEIPTSRQSPRRSAHSNSPNTHFTMDPRRILVLPSALQSPSASASASKPTAKPVLVSSGHGSIGARRSRPRFTLSVAHVAPPAMSITTTSLDDDTSSILTPSSAARSASASPKVIQHGRKPSNGSAIDPFIPSPPYEFAYNHGHQHCAPPIEQLVASAVRGRTLARA